jgi:P27 family predicted phage terminase small subunit
VPRKKSKKVSSKSSEQPALSEPVKSPPILLGECPAELGPVARQEWDRIVPLLAVSERITQLDLGPLAIYCTAHAAWLEAITALQTYGAVMKSPSGYPIQSPYVSIASKQAEIMIRIATEFGFTPASRMRLPDPSRDPLLLEIPRIEDLAAELKPWRS